MPDVAVFPWDDLPGEDAENVVHRLLAGGRGNAGAGGGSWAPWAKWCCVSRGGGAVRAGAWHSAVFEWDTVLVEVNLAL